MCTPDTGSAQEMEHHHEQQSTTTHDSFPSSDFAAYANRETNKRSHDHRMPGSRVPRQHKAQNHSTQDTPQRSQSLDHDCNSGSDREIPKERMPSLTDGSTCSSNDKSESPEDTDRADERLPMLENAIFSINLRFPERGGQIPILPSLGKDAVVQAAFQQQDSENGPHDGRYHGLSSSVYKEDQAWRQNPGEVDKLRQHLESEQPPASSAAVSQEVPSGPNGPNGPQGPSGSQQQKYNTHTQNVEASTLDRPFRCTHKDCDWSFSRSSDQKRHIRSHKKPLLQCPYWEHNSSCHRNGGAFNRLDVLKRHLKLMHFDIQTKESGKCKHCQQHFDGMKAFFDHCETCAGELGSELSKCDLSQGRRKSSSDTSTVSSGTISSRTT